VAPAHRGNPRRWQRAQAELSDRIARGETSDTGPTVTAAEWLEAHRADQAAEDAHRPITEADLADHELTDHDDQVHDPVAGGREDRPELANTRPADIRDTTNTDLADETGRIPTAEETRRAIRQAQAALAEIETRRALDAARASEEHRASQLNQWAADDHAAEQAHTADLAADLTHY
jgi:hypothetical protein